MREALLTCLFVLGKIFPFYFWNETNERHDTQTRLNYIHENCRNLKKCVFGTGDLEAGMDLDGGGLGAAEEGDGNASGCGGLLVRNKARSDRPGDWLLLYLVPGYSRKQNFVLFSSSISCMYKGERGVVGARCARPLCLLVYADC